MEFRELQIQGAWEVIPRQFSDPRGVFFEWFKASIFADITGRPLPVAQANMSVSAPGVLRGIHYADVPPGQAKYVTCVNGAVWDVVVDLRVDSPTFGKWDAVALSAANRRAVFLAEGLGHGFVALAPDSTVAYLCSTPYRPDAEHEINPLDPELGISWPRVDLSGNELEFQLSDKDRAAPSLAVAQAQGLLPNMATVSEFLTALKNAEGA